MGVLLEVSMAVHPPPAEQLENGARLYRRSDTYTGWRLWGQSEWVLAYVRVMYADAPENWRLNWKSTRFEGEDAFAWIDRNLPVCLRQTRETIEAHRRREAS